MKKTILLTVIGVAMAIASSAQTGTESSIKKNIKQDQKEKSIINKEERTERKQLRKLEGKEASYQSKQAFYKDFGNIPVSKWRRSKNFDEATFTQNGKKMTAYYDYNSSLVGTTTQAHFSDLPASAQKEINKQYPGYAKTEVIFFDDNENNDTDMVLYGQQFDDEDNYFVVLQKGSSKLIVHSDSDGNVNFFKQLSK